MPCSHAPSPFCPHSVSSLVSIPHPCLLSTCHPLLPAPSSHPSFTKSPFQVFQFFYTPRFKPFSGFLDSLGTNSRLCSIFAFLGRRTRHLWELAQCYCRDGSGKNGPGGRTRGRMLGKCFWGSQGGNGKWFSPVAPAQPLKVDTIPHKPQLFLQAGATINPTARAQV